MKKSENHKWMNGRWLANIKNFKNILAMSSHIHYLTFIFIIFNIIGAFLSFKYIDEYQHDIYLIIIITIWHLVNIALWIGIMMYNRLCYQVYITLLILYCIIGVTGIIILISFKWHHWNFTGLFIAIGGLAAMGNYLQLLLDNIDLENIWIALLVSIGLSAFQLWMLVLGRHYFKRK